MRNTFYRYVDRKTLPSFSKPDFEKIDFRVCKSNVLEDGKSLGNSDGRIYVIEKKNGLYRKLFGPLIDYIESLGDMTVLYIQYLITEPNSKMIIHNDRDMIYQNNSWIDADACSLNYSYGTLDSYLEFFKLKSAHYEKIERFRYIHNQEDFDKPYLFEGIREKDTNLVAEAKYDTKYATLVNCAVYHRAVNHSNVPRYVIHFRLVRKSNPDIDIKFREAKKIFKSHIVNI